MNLSDSTRAPSREAKREENQKEEKMLKMVSDYFSETSDACDGRIIINNRVDRDDCPVPGSAGCRLSEICHEQEEREDGERRPQRVLVERLGLG
jgi:hypothetical protein